MLSLYLEHECTASVILPQQRAFSLSTRNETLYRCHSWGRGLPPQAIVNSMNDEDREADWRRFDPSTIPLGSDEIALGIIYNANTLSLKVI